MKKRIEIALLVFFAAAANAENSYEFVTIAVPGSVPYSTIPYTINNNEVIALFRLAHISRRNEPAWAQRFAPSCNDSSSACT
jgi:hypothetical protein